MASKKLQIIIAGDAKGAVKAFGETEAAADGFGGKLKNIGGLAAGGFTVVGAAAIGGAAALYKVGETFDDAYDTIRVGTGATGQQLAGLSNDFRQVFKTVPTDAGKASNAIADLNTRLGLTGKPLQTLSEQFLEMTRLQGGDLKQNIDSVTGAMNNFGVSAGSQSKVLDEVFRVSQATGVSVSQLAADVGKGGPLFQSLGLNVEQATSFVGLMGKAGVPASRAISSLGTFVSKAAKAGVPAKKAFADLFNEIKTGTDPVKIMNDASSQLGRTLGPKLVPLIRSGKLNYQQLADTISKGGDTILGASKDTQDFAEKWTLFKNRVMLALEPVAAKVFALAGTLMDKLGPAFDQIGPIVQKVTGFFKGLFGGGGGGIGGKASALGETISTLADTFKAEFELIKTIVKVAVSFVMDLWDRFGGQLLSHLRTAWDALTQVFRGALDEIQGVFKLVTDLLTGKWGKLWGDFKQILSGAWNIISGIFRYALNAISTVLGLAMALISSLWSRAWDGITRLLGNAWNAIKQAVSNGINAVVQFLAALPGRILSAVAALPGLLLSVGHSLIGGLLTGAKAAWGTVSGWVSGIGSRVLGAVGNLGHRLFTAGWDLISGLWHGIKAAWNWAADRATFHLPKVHIPGTGVNIGGGTIHLLPHIAKGGIALARPGGIVANIAEGGQNEAILPLDRLQPMINKAVASAQGGARRGVVNNYYLSVNAAVLTVDQAAREIREALLRMQRRSAQPILPGVS